MKIIKSDIFHFIVIIALIIVGSVAIAEESQIRDLQHRVEVLEEHLIHTP